MWTLWLGLATAGTGCPADAEGAVEREALVAEVRIGLESHASPDGAQAAAAATDKVRRLVPCVNEPLSADDVTQLHLLFLVEQDGREAPALHRAWARLPDRAPSWPPLDEPPWTDLLAADPLGLCATVAPTGTCARVRLPRPARGSLLVNGLPSIQAPRGAPYLLQHVSSRGVQSTTWVTASTRTPYSARGSVLGAFAASSLLLSAVAYGGAEWLNYSARVEGIASLRPTGLSMAQTVDLNRALAGTAIGFQSVGTLLLTSAVVFR